MRGFSLFAFLTIATVACGSSVDTDAAGTVVSSASSSSTGGASASATTATSTGGASNASTATSGGAGGMVDKSATCASTFGSGLTDAFARLDGTVVAVVPPNDQKCAEPNMTHLVIQAEMNGAVYRLVLDVLSNQGSPNVLFYEMDAPLSGAPWSPGWHTGVSFDYVTDLSVHSTMFTAMVEDDLVAKVTSEIELGDKISVFSTSQNEHDSAHLIHRNKTNQDGAIVIHPDATTPHYLLFHFDEQMF